MAAALVGGSLLSAFLQVLFDRMARPEFLNLFRNRKADDDLLGKLKSELLTIEAVLDDAENQEIRNPSVKKWLEELHDTFYQAEDFLDKINTEALRIKVESEYQRSTSNWRSALRRLCLERILPCRSSGNKFLKRIMPEIETIVERLKERRQQSTDLHLQQIILLGHSRIESHQKFEIPLVDETTFIGRDADKERIIQKLLSEDANGDNITVVPIVGKGGLGKTTLAQIVYKDSRVTESFPTRALVCISEEYDATRITKELLRELRISFDQDEKLFSLQGKLQVGLTNKKFLLVLDDVWNDNYNDWDKLRTPFKGGSRGSKIIVTTRNQQVARMMAEERSIHHLDSMLEEDCRSLFKKHAFENRDGNENAELEEIGNEIVKKCRGLPLAVKTVAGVLRSKTTPEEWKEILVSEEWTKGPLAALRLSYIHLPSHLKRCFAYCAVFPKDYLFRKEEIIQLWQANDLLGYPGENKRIKNEGEKCFHELRMRSLFDQSTVHTFFSMHDLVNDLASFVFGKYCLRLEDHQDGEATISGARHFSYHPSFSDTFRKFNLLSQNKSIRTFLQLGMAYYPANHLSSKFLEDTLPQFMSLRFLSLSCYENIVKLPSSCSGFKQLRFLNLSYTRIKELPEWLCSFYNLQTLLLSECRQLEELPENLGKLINLCCLDISGTPLKKMPPQMGRLINLQVLTNFVIGKDRGSTIKELGKLRMLSGKLILSGLENVSAGMDASMANMEGKEHLESLTLEWNGEANDSQVAAEVLDKLRPHPSIKHLNIQGYCGATFPNWLGNSSLSRLESLGLSGCKYCLSLPALGQLQSLQSLEIVGMSCRPVLTQDFYGDISVTKQFPSLKKLRIKKLPEWERWHIPECEVFNRLEELSIIDCPKLIGELPRQLASLQSLEVSGCDNLVHPNGRLSIFNGEIRQNFSSLRRLKISELKNLKELPLQPNQLSGLETLEVDDCGSLSPSHVSRPPASLKSLAWMGRCTLELDSSSGEGGGALERLTLENCDSVKFKVEWLASFPMLKDVGILNCKSVEMLSVPAAPSGEGGGALEYLTLQNCDSVKVKVEWLASFPMLKYVGLHTCKGVEMLSVPAAPGIGNQSGMTTTTTTTTSSVMTSLRYLNISGCDDLIMSFPEGGLATPNLMQLDIWDCEKLTSLPQRMESLLPSLQYLRLSNCPEIECFPEGGLPSTLQSLQIVNCKKLTSRRREWGLEKLPSLTDLSIEGPCDEVESFPEEDWRLPCTVQYLNLNSLQNLKVLNYSALRHLTSLQKLYFYNCPRLQSLPDEGLPASLTTLRIRDCPLLKPRLEWEKGQDWHKVAHIRCVVVDQQPIP